MKQNKKKRKQNKMCAWKTFMKWLRRLHRLSAFLFRPYRLLYSNYFTIIVVIVAIAVVVIIVIVIIVVVSLCFNDFSVRVFTEMCTQYGHNTHMHTKTARPPIHFYHIWPLSLQLCAMPCTFWDMYIYTSYMLYGSQQYFVQKVYMPCMVWYGVKVYAYVVGIFK